MGRILYVWSPNWPITTFRRRHPDAWREDEPFALVETEKNARRLRAVNATAAELGLQPGWKLTDALAVLPGLKTAPAEPETEAAALQALADWCVRYSPAVAADAPDGLYLEVSGVETMWGEDERVILPRSGEGWAPRTGAKRRSAREDGVTDLKADPPSSPDIRIKPSGGGSRQSSVTPSSRMGLRPLRGLRHAGPVLPLTGEGVLLYDLLARLAAQGIPAQGAVASTPGAAWALARFAPQAAGRCSDGAVDRLDASLSEPTPRSRTAPAGRPRSGARDARVLERDAGSEHAPPSERRDSVGLGDRDSLRPLPVAALRLDPDTEAGLRRLGLRTIGQVMALPRAQLAKRFGQGLLLRLDQAMGDLEEALPYRRPPTPWFERLAFAEPISAPENLARVTFDVLAKLCARLEGEGKGARRFVVSFHRVDGAAAPLAVGTARTGRDAKKLARLFAPKLENVDPGFGVEAVTAEAELVETLQLRQSPIAGAAAAEAEAGVADLVDRLQARLGDGAVWRAGVKESWIPERSVEKRPPFAPAVAPRGWDPARPRPLRLFARPEPIEATAPVPDDPPVQFRWRGRVMRVRAAEGPERVAEEWWKRPIDQVGPSRVRDYYRVEDMEGRRFWLFRAGLYEPGAPARWFVHGLFG